MKNKVGKILRRLLWPVMLLVIVSPGTAHSVGFVPMSFSGALSYGYGYVRAEVGSEAESTSVTLNLNLTGFIWKPWFITTTGGLSFGVARAQTSASSNASSTAVAGNLGVNVFPSSRFPFSLLLSLSNSEVENRSALNTLGNANYTTTRVLMLQTYKGYDNFLTNFSWAYSNFQSDTSTSSSNAVNYDARYRKSKQSWVGGASYNENSNSDSDVKPQNFTIRMHHNYVPGNQLGVTSSVSFNESRVSSRFSNSRSSVAQASSVYSWRPEHKPYSFSGGARVSTARAEGRGDSESNSMSLSLGTNYRLTRKVNVSASGSMSAAETDSITTSNATFSASTGYNSDQYDYLGFRYNWRAAGGVASSSSTSQVEQNATEDETTSSLSFSLGHTASRNWALGRTSSLSLSLSQSGGLGYTNAAVGSGTIGHGVGLNVSSNDRTGSTFMGGSFTDTRSCTECEGTVDSESQFLSFQLARNQGINRLSSLSGNAAYQWGRQKKLEEDASNPGFELTAKSYTRSANMNANYHHSRAFGVYALNYTSSFAYSRNFNALRDQRDTLRWENFFTYAIGLLDTSLTIDFVQQGSDNVRGSLSFRATRNF
ncbi:MAG: hypothetical protein OEZ68_08430 [Gammaproteobacteria bacterium]|nr:hypothetical protein [Gammaproteobacteria bacterium]MDH5800814.1 hypothetical protein [Gammaproteobacteria bacterium]